MYRIFILSPAHCGGKRASYLFNPDATFDLARRLHSGEQPSVGEIYSFISGLYFRGKVAYAEAYARVPEGSHGALTITPNRGLLPISTPLSLCDLQSFAKTDIDHTDAAYREPLERDVRQLCARYSDCEIVLLGSIATEKYVQILLECFGERLLFPEAFVGRGDLSRGGLMLRSVSDRTELNYLPVAGATRRGNRPPRLPRLPRPLSPTGAGGNS